MCRWYVVAGVRHAAGVEISRYNIPWREVGNGWELENRFGLEEHATPGSFRLQGTQRTGTTVLVEGIDARVDVLDPAVRRERQRLAIELVAG